MNFYKQTDSPTVIYSLISKLEQYVKKKTSVWFKINTCATLFANFSPNETLLFALCICLSSFSLSVLTFLSVHVEKEEESKVHCQCKGF